MLLVSYFFKSSLFPLLLQFPDTCEESGSPFVFICTNPQELLVKFPMKGKHKICKSSSFQADGNRMAVIGLRRLKTYLTFIFSNQQSSLHLCALVDTWIDMWKHDNPKPISGFLYFLLLKQHHRYTNHSHTQSSTDFLKAPSVTTGFCCHVAWGTSQAWMCSVVAVLCDL